MVRVCDRSEWALAPARFPATEVAGPGDSRDRYVVARAFTMIEVIIVIAIFALLLGILMPAMQSARLTARMMQSKSNLRQMFIMAEQYGDRSNGRYPVAVRYERRGSVFETIAWDWRQTSDGRVEPGPLWQFGINPGEVMQDPQFLSGSSTFGNDPFTGYNYNTTFIGGEAIFPFTGWENVRHGLPRGTWRKTTTTAVFGLGGWKGGANKFMRAPENTVEGSLQTVYAGGQAFRYNGRTLVCYLDGHTDAVGLPREGVHATQSLLRDIMDYPRNGFLSDDDSAYDPR